MKKSKELRQLDKMFGWDAMRKSPRYSKAENGEAWLRRQKETLSRGLRLANLEMSLSRIGKTKRPILSALPPLPGQQDIPSMQQQEHIARQLSEVLANIMLSSLEQKE